MSLMKIVTGLMSDGMVGKVASMVGVNSGIAKTALRTIMPRILRGIASKGSTESGAGALLNMIKNNGLGANLSLNEDVMSSGGKMNESIFGSSLKDVKIPGVSGEARAKLMNLATPLAMGSLGKVVSEKNLDAKGLSSYLRENVEAVKMETRASAPAAAATTSTGGGGGLLKWLLPLALLAGLAWWLTRPKTVETTSTTEPVPAQHKTTNATHTHSDGTVHSGHSHGTTTTTTNAAKDAAGKVTQGAAGAATGAAGAAGNMLDKAKDAAGAATGAAGAAGNMLDKAKDAAGNVTGATGGAGNMLDKAKDAAGNATDAAGNMVDKVKGAAATGAGGDLLDKAKGAAGAVGDAAGNVGGGAADAVKGAADKTGAAIDAAKKGLDAAKGGDVKGAATDAAKKGLDAAKAKGGGGR